MSFHFSHLELSDVNFVDTLVDTMNFALIRHQIHASFFETYWTHLTDDGHDALRGGGLEHGCVARDLAAEGARRREVHVVQHQLALRREVRLEEERCFV